MIEVEKQSLHLQCFRLPSIWKALVMSVPGTYWLWSCVTDFWISPNERVGYFSNLIPLLFEAVGGTILTAIALSFFREAYRPDSLTLTEIGLQKTNTFGSRFWHWSELGVPEFQRPIGHGGTGCLTMADYRDGPSERILLNYNDYELSYAQLEAMIKSARKGAVPKQSHKVMPLRAIAIPAIGVCAVVLLLAIRITG